MLNIALSQDYDHFYRKLLRSGGLDIEASLRVLKTYFSLHASHAKYFTNVLPSEKTDKFASDLVNGFLPVR